MWMLAKKHPDVDASAAVFGCLGAVFEHSSTSCSRGIYFQLANYLSAAPFLTECSLKIVAFALS
jgi:hypothetical protein